MASALERLTEKCRARSTKMVWSTAPWRDYHATIRVLEIQDMSGRRVTGSSCAVWGEYDEARASEGCAAAIVGTG